ncbi:hypothetical protein EX30DRAFT_343347 [Ascodesmis nigricans]|uniref:Uncharacterized protein n=1 Tax=Ascodesmis nigricans TaxID=341454 RepID=A0A4S2MMJ3_9PEZI|nr:hypothetical protein EX30DRAFT_343347 [Ascodesmis nigricans]
MPDNPAFSSSSALAIHGSSLLSTQSSKPSTCPRHDDPLSTPPTQPASTPPSSTGPCHTLPTAPTGVYESSHGHVLKGFCPHYRVSSDYSCVGIVYRLPRSGHVHRPLQWESGRLGRHRRCWRSPPPLLGREMGKEKCGVVGFGGVMESIEAGFVLGEVWDGFIG